MTAAPPAQGDADGRIWIVEHPDGLDTKSWTLVRVWVAGWDGGDVATTTNRHVGIDRFGTPGPVAYRIAERTSNNNTSTGWV